MKNPKKTIQTPAETKEMLEGFRSFLMTKTTVGEPITVGDTTIIPFNEISLGVAAGIQNAGGMGARITPTDVLLVKDGIAKIISLSEPDTVVRILEMIPDVLDRIKLWGIKPTKEEQEKIDGLKNKKQ